MRKSKISFNYSSSKFQMKRHRVHFDYKDFFKETTYYKKTLNAAIHLKPDFLQLVSFHTNVLLNTEIVRALNIFL